MRLLRKTAPSGTLVKRTWGATKGPPSLSACVAHRCEAHTDVPPLNLRTPEHVECGACIADDVVQLKELSDELAARLDEACRTLDLLEPGSGDRFRLSRAPAVN